MNDYTHRLEKVRQQLKAWQVDAILITNPTNRRWLSGFTGSAGQLLISMETAVISTDSRYWTQAAAQSPHFALFKDLREKEDSVKFFQTVNAKRIGVESQHLTLNEFSNLQKIEGVEWVKLEESVEPFRAEKTESEIEAIQQAAAITDATMAEVNQLAHLGMTERALAWQLEKQMRERGADGMAFSVIVASGPNSALPHHSPGDRKLQAGDVLIVDMGAALNGYNSDLTRSFYLGSEPSDRFWEVYNLVLEAETAVFDQLTPGITAQQADSIARDIISAAGHADHFGHGLGHGVGLDIHEAPGLSPRETAANEIIKPSMTVTVEPGIYIPGWGGIRIEDLAKVTSKGLISLSHCPKTPIISI